MGKTPNMIFFALFGTFVLFNTAGHDQNQNFFTKPSTEIQMKDLEKPVEIDKSIMDAQEKWEDKMAVNLSTYVVDADKAMDRKSKYSDNAESLYPEHKKSTATLARESRKTSAESDLTNKEKKYLRLYFFMLISGQ